MRLNLRLHMQLSMHLRSAFAAVAAALLWLLAPALQAAPPDVLQVSEIAPGVFVHQGVHEEFGDGYHGDIASIGFVIGDEAIAVIDTGGSFRIGSALRDAIRARSSLPIRYVINTHVHSDHIFGNAAFVQDRPEFIGHQRLSAAMRSRGPQYEENLARMLGDAAQGSRIVLPTLAVQEAMTLDLGGRRLSLRAWQAAHTDHDLTVLDETTATLWAGDLLFVERAPSIEGDLKGWLSVMQSLQAAGAARTVPGHGPAVSDARPYFDKQRRYLQVLQDDVRRGLAEGLKLQQVTARAAASERSQWLLFDSVNPRNAEMLYLQMEWE